MLVLDGALQFGDQSKFTVDQFKNVIGVSKTFQPNLQVGKGKKKEDIGTIAKRLDFAERTYVFGTKFGKYKIGSWYLKLREAHILDKEDLFHNILRNDRICYKA